MGEHEPSREHPTIYKEQLLPNFFYLREMPNVHVCILISSCSIVIRTLYMHVTSDLPSISCQIAEHSTAAKDYDSGIRFYRFVNTLHQILHHNNHARELLVSED